MQGRCNHRLGLTIARLLGFDYKLWQVLAIQTTTGELSLLGSLPAGMKKFQGGALGPDGTIWGLPESCEHILRIRPL